MPSIALPVSLRGQLLSGTRTFSPASLFSANEPGVWFDPSDLTTLFTDPAGTTPVTTPGQTVGLMLDKSKGLVPGPELVVNGGFATDTWWSKSGTTISGGTANWSAAADNSWLLRSAFLTANTVYRITWTITSVSSGGLRLHDGSIFSPTRSSPGTYTETFRATGTNFYVLSTGASTTASIDNISVRELAGNHATQATLAARPTYSIEPVGGRRNLLTQTNDLTNLTNWPTGDVSLGSRTGAGVSVTNAEGYAYIAKGLTSFSYTSGTTYTFSATVVCDQTIANVPVRFAGGFGANAAALFNLQAGVPQRISISATATSSAAALPQFGIDARDAVVPGGSNATGYVVTFSDPQLELGSTATPYQRVTTQYDVTEAGKPTMSYLYFDGVNDAMVTSTITPGIGKAQVFAGVRKLDDGTRMIAEMGASGPFSLYNYSIGPVYTWTGATSGVITAPITNVITGTFDTATNSAALRLNSSQVGSGTPGFSGNVPAAVLNIGARSGSAIFLFGHLYSLITRFGATLDTPSITSTESWVASKTGFYSPVITGVPTVGVS